MVRTRPELTKPRASGAGPDPETLRWLFSKASEDGFRARASRRTSVTETRRGAYLSAPRLALLLLTLLMALTLLVPLLYGEDGGRFHYAALNVAPCSAYPLGTDPLGRDLLYAILKGALPSFSVGLIATALALLTGVGVGTLMAYLPGALSGVGMRCIEVLSGLPQLVLLLFISVLLERPSVTGLGTVMGLTGWFAIARLTYFEVLRLKSSPYLIAATFMGTGLLRKITLHLLPALTSALSFTVIATLGTFITLEATLSFLGLGLPADTLSLGTLLSLANRALLTGAWWVVVFPGAYLVLTLLSLSALSLALRGKVNRRCSYL